MDNLATPFALSDRIALVIYGIGLGAAFACLLQFVAVLFRIRFFGSTWGPDDVAVRTKRAIGIGILSFLLVNAFLLGMDIFVWQHTDWLYKILRYKLQSLPSQRVMYELWLGWAVGVCPGTFFGQAFGQSCFRKSRCVSWLIVATKGLREG